MNTVILAIFIASTGAFEAALPVGSDYQQKQFPNSDAGIRQLGQWIEETGVTEYDHVCVTGPSIESTSVLRFWSRRSGLVFFMRYAQLQEYVLKHNLPQASATAVAGACAELVPKK